VQHFFVAIPRSGLFTKHIRSLAHSAGSYYWTNGQSTRPEYDDYFSLCIDVKMMFQLADYVSIESKKQTKMIIVA